MAYMIYAVTHGKREIGVNPSHTNEGTFQLLSPLMVGMVALITHYGTKLVLVGTGTRFEETYLAFRPTIDHIHAKWSPFCGTEDSLIDRDGQSLVVTGAGRVILPSQYIGIPDHSAFHAWEFVKSLPDFTLLFTGRQLLKALGVERARSCSIYEIFPNLKTIKCIIENGVFLNKPAFTKPATISDQTE